MYAYVYMRMYRCVYVNTHFLLSTLLVSWPDLQDSYLAFEMLKRDERRRVIPLSFLVTLVTLETCSNEACYFSSILRNDPEPQGWLSDLLGLAFVFRRLNMRTRLRLCGAACP